MPGPNTINTAHGGSLVPYNVANWFWLVGGSTTSVWSSSAGVDLSTTDANYLAWIAAGNMPARIGSYDDLYALLEQGAPAAAAKLLAAHPTVASVSPVVLSQPTTGATLTSPSNRQGFVLDPAGTLATLTVNLPAGIADNQRFRVSTTQTITALTMTPASGQSIRAGGPFQLSANNNAEWIFLQGTATWYPWAGAR